MTNEDERGPEERELGRRMRELQKVEQQRAPEFGQIWHAAARQPERSSLRLALLGVGGAAVVGAAVVLMVSLSIHPTPPVAAIDWSGQEPLGFLLSPPLKLVATNLEPDTDPYSLHLAEVLRAADTGAAR